MKSLKTLYTTGLIGAATLLGACSGTERVHDRNTLSSRAPALEYAAPTTPRPVVRDESRPASMSSDQIYRLDNDQPSRSPNLVNLYVLSGTDQDYSPDLVKREDLADRIASILGPQNHNVVESFSAASNGGHQNGRFEQYLIFGDDKPVSNINVVTYTGGTATNSPGQIITITPADNYAFSEQLRYGAITNSRVSDALLNTAFSGLEAAVTDDLNLNTDRYFERRRSRDPTQFVSESMSAKIPTYNFVVVIDTPANDYVLFGNTSPYSGSPLVRTRETSNSQGIVVQPR